MPRTISNARTARNAGVSVAPIDARSSNTGLRVVTGKERVRVATFRPDLSDIREDSNNVATILKMTGQVAGAIQEEHREKDILKGARDQKEGIAPTKKSKAYMRAYDSGRAKQNSSAVVEEIMNVYAERDTYNTPEEFEAAREGIYARAFEGESDEYAYVLGDIMALADVAEQENASKLARSDKIEDIQRNADFQKKAKAYNSPEFAKAQTTAYANDAASYVNNAVSELAIDPASSQYKGSVAGIVALARSSIISNIENEEEQADALAQFAEAIEGTELATNRAARDGEIKRNAREAAGTTVQQTTAYVNGILQGATGFNIAKIGSDPDAWKAYNDAVADGAIDLSDLPSKLSSFAETNARLKGVSRDTMMSTLIGQLAEELGEAGVVEVMEAISFPNDNGDATAWSDAIRPYAEAGDRKNEIFKRQAEDQRAESTRVALADLAVTNATVDGLTEQRDAAQGEERVAIQTEINTIKAAARKQMRSNPALFNTTQEYDRQAEYFRKDKGHGTEMDAINMYTDPSVTAKQMEQKLAVMGADMTSAERNTFLALYERKKTGEDKRLLFDINTDLALATRPYEHLLKDGDRDLLARRAMQSLTQLSIQEGRILEPKDYTDIVKNMDEVLRRTLPKGWEEHESEIEAKLAKSGIVDGDKLEDVLNEAGNIATAFRSSGVPIEEQAVDFIASGLTDAQMEKVLDEYPELSDAVADLPDDVSVVQPPVPKSDELQNTIAVLKAEWPTLKYEGSSFSPAQRKNRQALKDAEKELKGLPAREFQAWLDDNGHTIPRGRGGLAIRARLQREFRNQ